MRVLLTVIPALGAAAGMIAAWLQYKRAKTVRPENKAWVHAKVAMAVILVLTCAVVIILMTVSALT